MRFFFRDLADYVSWATNTAGALALVFRKLSDEERESVEAELREALAPVARDRGYELPGLTLNAVAS